MTGKSRMWSIRKIMATLCIPALTNYISIKIKADTNVSMIPFNISFTINYTQLDSKLSLYIEFGIKYNASQPLTLISNIEIKSLASGEVLLSSACSRE